MSYKLSTKSNLKLEQQKNKYNLLRDDINKAKKDIDE
jgi:hypothetical protein